MTETQLREAIAAVLTPDVLREALEAANTAIREDEWETDWTWAAAHLRDVLAQELAVPE